MRSLALSRRVYRLAVATPVVAAAALLLPECVSVPRQATPPAADFSGVDEFWRIAATLRADREPADADWDRLFATPGYAALHTRERRRPALTAAFRAALMPSRRAERDQLLARGGWIGRVIRHVEPLWEQRAELDRARVTLGTGTWLARAIDKVAEVLPTGTTTAYPAPPVAFIFFLPDGRGYADLLVADLANVASKDDLVAFFAHEVFHYYHHQLARARPEAAPRLPPGPGEQALLDVLTKIEEESVADLFDKAHLLTLDSAVLSQRVGDPARVSYLREYQVHYADAAHQLELIERTLEAVADMPDRMKQASDTLGALLPLEGRPVGAFMAAAIRRELGTPRLASVIADPVGFFLAYQEAANRPGCGCRPFSRKAVAVLRRLS
jgi:hypothetical protein